MNELTSLKLISLEWNFKKIGSLILLVTNVERMLKDGLSCYEKQHMEDFKGYVVSSIDDLNAFYDFYCEVTDEIHGFFDDIKKENASLFENGIDGGVR